MIQKTKNYSLSKEVKTLLATMLATICDNNLNCHKFTDEEVFFVVFKNERKRSVSMLACPMEEQVFEAITRYADRVTNVARIFKINTEGEVTQLKCTFENGYLQLLHAE